MSRGDVLMNVLWIIDSLGPGGAESLMPPLLRNFDRAVINPRVCVLQVRNGNPVANELIKIGVPVDLMPVKNLRDFSGFRRLLAYIKEHKPDIIHTQLETSDIFGTLAAKYLGIPSVSTAHTLDIPSRMRRTYWRNLLRWTILRLFSKHVIVVSDMTRNIYRKLGFGNAKLITLYNGIDLGIFQPNGAKRQDLRKTLPLPADGIVLITVAVLREQKGLQYMLKALPDIMNDLPDTFYVIVGDGSYRKKLEELSRSLGIDDRVVFLGHRTDIPFLLAASDMFVFPTLQDALPTALFEAMAVGLPIVASEVGGVPEILHHGEDGLLVPPADPSKLTESCLCLLRDKALSARLGLSARKTVEERFDIRIQVQKLSNLYKQVDLTP